MNDIDIQDPTIPLIGQQKVRVHERRIDPFIMNDSEGSATLRPQADLTPLEGLRIAELLLWCTTTPGGGQAIPDPATQGRTPLVVRTMWREFIMAEKIERHFDFSGVRSDLATTGSA